jgi:hypothetical protein
MHKESQFGETLLLTGIQTPYSSQRLRRLQFDKNAEGHQYNEAWLQELLHAHPEILPMGQIEPGFDELIPICRELPVAGGFADNLFATPNGNIVLVECKLWRNPQARREVIAQIIEYASAIATWKYEALDEAIKRTSPAAKSLFEKVSAMSPETGEALFHDAVARNLKLGRILLLIVGDGIKEELETIAEFLQKYAGLHFTLSLVEIVVFELPSQGFIVQPRVLVKTQNIVRAIVKLDDARLLIAPESESNSRPPVRKANITEEEFFQELDTNSPGSSDALRELLNSLSELNVHPNYGVQTLTLRWTTEDSTWNLGTIVNSGDVWMDYHASHAFNRHMLSQSKKYLETLAALVPGAVVKPTKGMGAWNIANSKGHAIRVSELLADKDRITGWVNAIQQFEKDVLQQESN